MDSTPPTNKPLDIADLFGGGGRNNDWMNSVSMFGNVHQQPQQNHMQSQQHGRPITGAPQNLPGHPGGGIQTNQPRHHINQQMGGSGDFGMSGMFPPPGIQTTQMSHMGAGGWGTPGMPAPNHMVNPFMQENMDELFKHVSSHLSLSLITVHRNLDIHETFYHTLIPVRRKSDTTPLLDCTPQGDTTL